MSPAELLRIAAATAGSFPDIVMRIKHSTVTPIRTGIVLANLFIKYFFK